MRTFGLLYERLGKAVFSIAIIVGLLRTDGKQLPHKTVGKAIAALFRGVPSRPELRRNNS